MKEKIGDTSVIDEMTDHWEEIKKVRQQSFFIGLFTGIIMTVGFLMFIGVIRL